MTLDQMLAVGGLAVGVIGIALSYFSFTNERFADFLVRRRVRAIPAMFSALARDYRLADDIPDDPSGPVERKPWESRVKQKDLLAEGLCRFAQGAHLKREKLLAANDDGYLVALMKMISAEPKRGDIDLIVRASARDVSPHTDYRTLEAIESVAAKGLLRVDERGSLDVALKRIEDRLGGDGRARVRWAQEQVRNAPG
jgi:hypothetical protein